MKLTKTLLVILGLFTLIYSCSDTSNTIKPAEFPTHLGIKDFNFPEDSNKIYTIPRSVTALSIVVKSKFISMGKCP